MNKLFLEDGTTPKYVRVYDNGGKTLDRITVVFTKKRVNGEFVFISASENGTGFYQHGFSETPIDKPKYRHLGKKIKFNQLSKKLQFEIECEYCDLWGLKG